MTKKLNKTTLIDMIPNIEKNKVNKAILLAAITLSLILLIFSPAKAAITSISNSPDPFDNQVVGQTSYMQASPGSGTSAFPNHSDWLGTDMWDLTFDIFDPSGAFVRRLWANHLNAWPARPNGNLPPDFDGRGQWNSATGVRGNPLAYGTYTGKLTQGITETFSTKVPTLYLMGRPTDIFVSSDGTIYVLNDATKKVLRYSSDGTLLLSGFDVTLDNSNNELQGLVLDSSGNILIAEHDMASDMSRIQKYSSTGTLVNACFIPWNRSSCPTPRNSPGIQIADGMAIDSSNNIYLADSMAGKIYKFTAAGGNQAPVTVGTATSGWTPREVAVDPSDNNKVYFIQAKDGTPNGNNETVCRLFSGSWGSCANPWNSNLSLVSNCDPLGVAADSTYLYVSCACDAANYVYGGTDTNCADNLHTVYSFNKGTKASVSNFGSTPPGSANDKFNVPHGLALSSGLTNTVGSILYVAESGNNRIKKLSLAAGAMTFSNHIFDEYSTPYPTSIDMDADGNVYVALASSGLIKKFDQDGNLKCAIGGFGTGSGLFQNLYGLAVSDDGTYLWASDVNDDSVDRYIMTDKTTCTGSWTIIDTPAPGNMNAGPRGIVVEPGVAGSSAHAYVLHDQNKKIYRYTAAGVRDNFASLSADPRYITMDKQGFLYVVYENGSIDKLSNTGTVIESFSNAATYVTAGGGIAVDDYGNLYVTDRGDYTADPPTKGMTVHRFGNYVNYNQVSGALTAHVINWQNQFRGVCDPRLATCTPPGSGDTQLNSAWGVAVSNDGRYVWVADYGNNRLVKYNIGYAATVTDQITIGNAAAPPDVSSVSVNPVSPVPAGQMKAVVSFNKAMMAYETPSVQVITQNNCQLPIYDEAVVLDNGDGVFTAAADTKYFGVTPPDGTALVSFRTVAPKEGFIDFPLGGGGDGIWNYNTGEPIVGDSASSANQIFNATADSVLYTMQTTPSGIPIDLDTKAFITMNASVKHTDTGPTANYFDGYYNVNEWRGWITIPAGSTACCGGSCDGTAQIQVANGKDSAGTIESPNPWNVNTSTGFHFVIDTTAPTEPTITVPSDGTYTSQNSVAVDGSYNDANGYQVTVSSTDFTCVVREAAASNNNVYNAGTDTLIYGSCADGTALLPMTTKEGWIDAVTANNQYDAGEPIIGNYYDINPADPRYDQGTEPCSNCDRILLNLGSFSNLAVVKLFSSADARIKVNRVSTQTVDSTGTYSANNISLPSLSTYYITAIGVDTAGNYSPYVSKRVKVSRGQGNPGVAGITPSTSVGISTAGQWAISYTAASAFNYPTPTAACSCGATPTPSTEALCYVTITIPSGWAPPTETPNTSGTVSVSATGDTILCPTDTFSVSGRTIKVHVYSMNAGQTLTVNYGYPSSGIDVTEQAAIGGNSFSVQSKNSGDPSPVTVPPETGKTLSIIVEGYAMRVSHIGYLPGTIYDNQTNIKVMTLNFENPNTVGSGKTIQVSSIKLRFKPSGTQTTVGTIARIVAKSGATEFLNSNNISSMTDIYNDLTLTLTDADSNPLTVGESSVKTLDIYMDFNQLSTLYPVGSALEFILDGDYNTESGTSTGLTSTVLTKATAAWTTNQWVSHTLIPDLTVPTKSYRIKANTATTLTIRSGDMIADGAVSGRTFAIGDASNYVIAKDQTSGTAIHIAPRTGSVTDTFYPDLGETNPQMTTGVTTQFKAPPIANGLLVVKKDTWAVGQVLSRGQTSTKPIVLSVRLFDQIVTSTNAGANCAPNCSTLFVGDTSVFTGMEGQTVIIGDDDNYTSATIAPGGIDAVGKAITLSSTVGPFYVNKNMFILRDGASAKIARLVFSLYDCATTGCAPSTVTTNPRGLLDRVALRQTGSDPSFFYVNKEDSSLENTGSTVTLDFSTYLQLSGAEKKSMDLLLDVDSVTTAQSMKISLLDASMVYPNSRKALTNNCAACSRVYINNSVTNDIIQNERMFISTNGSTGEWSAVSGENASYIDVTPAYTGSYTTTSFVEHTKVQSGYESTALQAFPLNSLSVSIVNAAQIRVNKMYVRDANGAALCPNTEAGTGTDNPELYYGTSFKVYLDIENISTAPSSMAYIDATASDLSFIRLSDSTDYRSEFVVTPPSIVGGTCMHQACLTTAATSTLVYTVVQSGGTTVAPTASANYFKIDTYTTSMIDAPECDTSKTGRYKPKSVDSNDYTDQDIFCVNPDSNGVDADPPNCRLSTKTAEAYVLTDPVQLKYVNAGSTFVPIMNFLVYDGPTGNSGQIITEMKFQSQNSSDTYVSAVQLWKDDGDNVFDPYVNNGTAKQILLDDCSSCSVLKVNDAARYAVGQNVTVCHNAACSASSAKTVTAVDTSASPNTITLNSALAVSISQKTALGYIYINNSQVCNAGATNCDTLLGTATFSGGVATFSALAQSIPDTSNVRYHLSYNINTSLDSNGYYADGSTIDAAIKTSGITFTNNPAVVSPIPSADTGSSGSSKIDLVAVMVTADPPNSQSCVQGQRLITFKASDIFENIDRGSYGNPTTYANANITVTFTESKNTGGSANTVDFVSSSLTGATYSPANPPGDANQVKGDLTNGIGTVTITDVESAPPEDVTINLTTSLTYKPAGGAVTTFGNNVCMSAVDITGLEPPAGQVKAPVLTLQVINGLGSSINIDSLKVNKSSSDTLASSELSLIRLWRDGGTAGACEVCYPTLGAGDTQIATGNYSGGSVTFSGFAPVQTIASGVKTYFYVTYDINTTVTDGRVIDAEIPINGLTYSVAGVPTSLDLTSANSPGISRVNIQAHTLELYPYASTSTVTVDCNEGQGVGTNCRTFSVSDVAIFVAGDRVSIQDNDSGVISSFLTVQSVNPSGAITPTAGTITFTSPATGTYTLAQEAYVSNTPEVSKQITVRAVDTYGNIASYAANETYEATTQLSVTADTTQPDPSDTKVIATSLAGGSLGGPSTNGAISNGVGTVTFIENSCPPRRVLITPGTAAAGFTTFRTATIRFPGDINRDNVKPVASAIALNVSGSCITTSTPEISTIEGSDNCSGISGMRFACKESELANAPWVSIQPSQIDLDVCCNCTGDSRDIKCGFDVTNGQTCLNWDGTACLSGWISNTGDPNGGCADSANKTVYLQVKDRNGNQSAIPTVYTSPPVVIDNTLPAITGVSVTSNQNAYFYGSQDNGSICDANPQSQNKAGLNADCTVWFNSLAGMGAGQIPSVQLIGTDNNAITALEGDAAFGLPAQWNYASPAGTPKTLSVSYNNITAGAASSTVYFTDYDTCSNTIRVRVDFGQDNQAPVTPAVSGYSDSGKTVALTSGNWYNYSNPYFEWAAVSDLPSGAASGLAKYTINFSTDSTATPIYDMTANNFTATGPLVAGNSYYMRFTAYDNVGNYINPASTTFVFKYDNLPPSTTIVGPAASSWHSSAFTADVTNADTGGSGLNVCYYRVLSNAVQTLAWTSYACATDPSISVGAAANCRDQGADKCQVEFYDTDLAGNTGTTVTRTFSIDWTAPTSTITAPAASAWESAAFDVSVTNSDADSGLNLCYYRVLSNAVQTKVWTAYGCATNPNITVGAGMNCRDQGADMCDVQVYATDNAGNTGTSTSRTFSIDYTAPTTTIVGPAASSWQSAAFTADVTNADTGGSGLNVCYYRVLSNAVETLAWTSYACATDPSITVGAAANCRDQGADMCQVEFYDTDNAGNTGTTVTRTFSIDYTAPT
ncbi:MAG: NHL repeat-containing protein, partial [bacterium]